MAILLQAGVGIGTVLLWDVASGNVIHTLTHTDWITSVSFSPDGHTIATGSDDNIVRLWDVASGNTIHTLTGHTGRVNGVAFSPDGNKIASASRDKTVRLWEVGIGQPHTHPYRAYRLRSGSVSFSPDGNKIASAGGDKTVRLWDVVSGNTTHTLTGHTDSVNSVSFSPDGNTLATGSADGTVLLWDLAPEPDTVEPPQLPEDVNNDGEVGILDLVTVSGQLGQTGDGLSGDVNGDGTVNILDLVAVSARFGQTTTPQAPVVRREPQSVFPTPETIQNWIDRAHAADDGSLTFRRGIAVLEQLLAALTPKVTVLLPNYPNPFNPETWIPYHLSEPADVMLTIYAVDGKVVRTLDLGHQAAGFYTARSKAAYWDGRNTSGEMVASGVYFYQLTAGDFSATRRMVIVK